MCVSHLYIRTPVPRFVGWCFGTGAALCDHPVTLVWVFLPASKYSGTGGEGQDDPPALLAAAGRFCWREMLRANASKHSLSLSVAGQKKGIRSDLTLGSLQVVTVYPGGS